MKIKFLFIPLTLIVFFQSCTNKDTNNYTITVDKFPIRKEIKLDSVIITNKLFNPQYLISCDNHLVCFNNDMSNDIFQVYRIPDCVHIGSFGRFGKGPQEFLEINRRFISPWSNDEFYLLDNMMLKFVKLNIDSLGVNFSISKTIKIPGEFLPVNALVYPGNSFLYGSSPYFDGEYFSYNLADKKKVGIGEPENHLNLEGLKYSGLKTMNLSNMHLRPDSNRIAVLYGHIPLLRIFDNEMKIIAETKLKSIDKQSFRVSGSGELLSNDKSFTCYLEVKTTQNYIYGLYLGEQTQKENKQAEKQGIDNIRPRIHIFDWTGKTIADYGLNKTILHFTVDKDDRYIFGVSPYHENIIYKYSLDNK